MGIKSVFSLGNAVRTDNLINDFKYTTWNNLIAISKVQKWFIKYAPLFLTFVVFVALYVKIVIISNEPLGKLDIGWFLKNCILNIIGIIGVHILVQGFLKFIFKDRIV